MFWGIAVGILMLLLGAPFYAALGMFIIVGLIFRKRS